MTQANSSIIEPTANRAWLSATAAYAARNESVPIRPVRPDEQIGAAAHQFLTRIFTADETGAIVVEHPGKPELGLMLKPGSYVDVLIVDQGARWRGICRVLQLGEFHLNAQTTVQAIQLAPPENIESAQRRGHYRVNTTQTELQPVELRVIDASGDEPIEASLVNLSGGGMGLRIPSHLGEGIEQGARCICTLNLPTLKNTLTLNATAVYVNDRGDRTLYLGMKFDWADAIEQQRVKEHIIEFTTELERELMRKRRAR